MLFRYTLDGAGLDRASSADDAEQDGDNGDNQQYVDQSTTNVEYEKAEYPAYY